MDLTLPVRADYFEQIETGAKVEELKAANAYWTKRLEGQHFDHVIITRGTPSADDNAKRIVRPWQGFRRCWIQSPNSSFEAVEVFAIAVHDPQGPWHQIDSAPREGVRVLLRFANGFDRLASWQWHPVGAVRNGVFERGAWMTEGGVPINGAPVSWRIFPIEAQALLLSNRS